MARVGELVLAGGNRRLLLLAIGAGLVAAILVFVAVQSSGGDSSSSSGGETTAAVVASKAIAAGATITADDLKVVQVPTALLVTGVYSDTAKAVGQVTRVAIPQGEQITAGKLGSATKSYGLNSVVPKGKRAISVPVEQVTAVGGNLLPGDRVDILAIYSGAGGAVGNVSTILQNIEVLAIAQEAQTPLAAPASGDAGDSTSTSGQVPGDVKTKADARTITLAVDPQQAQVLAGVQEVAKIYLTLRSFGDQDTSAVPPVGQNPGAGQ